MKRISGERMAALLLTVGILLTGCGCRKPAAPQAGTLADLNDPAFTIGGMTGIVATRAAQEKLPDAAFQEYSMPIDAFTALCARKIDAVVLDRPTLEYMALAHPELMVMPGDLEVGHIAVAAAKRSTQLMDQVNAFIRAYRHDGTYQAMVERWFHTKNSAMPEIAVSDRGEPLKIGVTANNEPLCFIQNCELAGFDSEFALRLGAFLHRKVVFKDMPYEALVAALESGKIDLAVAFMDAMPEREESVLFSENYVDAPITVLIHKERFRSAVPAAASPSGPGFWASLTESFNKTFLRESRWKLILQGLLTTVVITFFAVIFGTALAFPLCMMQRSRRRWAAGLAERYISLVMGTPILVILMILYYVVFAKVDIDGIMVAILAFALDFSAYTSVMLRSGIDGVPRGQTEAALALGHTPSAVFFRFVLPQAIPTILPVYRSEIISTLKATSIVGYVAVMDLTKMGDIIRSRTYEAFFPLIAIAVIYFLAAKCLTSLLIMVEAKVDPEARRTRLMKRGEK